MAYVGVRATTVDNQGGAAAYARLLVNWVTEMIVGAR
jgi:hypothetical protein